VRIIEVLEHVHLIVAVGDENVGTVRMASRDRAGTADVQEREWEVGGSEFALYM
jgi:hypothetical protein